LFRPATAHRISITGSGQSSSPHCSQGALGSAVHATDVPAADGLSRKRNNLVSPPKSTNPPTASLAHPTPKRERACDMCPPPSPASQRQRKDTRNGHHFNTPTRPWVKPLIWQAKSAISQATRRRESNNHDVPASSSRAPKNKRHEHSSFSAGADQERTRDWNAPTL